MVVVGSPIHQMTEVEGVGHRIEQGEEVEHHLVPEVEGVQHQTEEVGHRVLL